MRQQGGFFYWLKITIILAIVGAGFFCGQKVWADQSIIINELLIKPTENRFIELYNPNNFSIDLTDWYLQRKTSTGASFGSLVSKTYFEGKTIGANSYFLITRVTVENTDIVFSGLTLTDLNTIQLKNSNQEIVDIVEFGIAPEDGKSLERKADSSWQASQNTGGTPRAANGTIVVLPPPEEPPITPPDSNPPGNDTASTTDQNTDLLDSSPPTGTTVKVNKLGDIAINEFVSDPADNEVEWIEFFNKTGRDIDLTGWKIEEGGKTKTNLSGTIEAAGSGRYKIIEKPAGNLNNAGDIIILYDADGRIIDQVAYGGWADGYEADNAPTAQDPMSLARKLDGYNTFNNANDFAVTLKPTKGAGNIIETENEVSAEAMANFDFSGNIYLSEIMPNPTGEDTKLEFIEIYNAGSRDVNLTGWSLSREDDKKINLEKIASSSIIKAGEYLAFFRPLTKIVLRNDQGEIKLFQPLAEEPAQAVNYKDVKEGWTYNLLDHKIKDTWVWSETPTAGTFNIFKTANRAPDVEFSLPPEALIGVPILFDGSDTADPDEDKLKFTWDFGDGINNHLINPEHTYFKAGIYKVILTVSDDKATSTNEKNLKVVSKLDEMSVINEVVPSIGESGNNNIIINEIFPNPESADTGSEWLELKSQSDFRINLLNWHVENENGKYKFKNDLWLEAGDFYLLDNTISKLAFKNTADTISLFDSLEELVDRAEYAEAVEGQTYARGANGKWFWTTALTPGEKNIISLAESAANLSYQVSGLKINATEYMETDLEKIRGLEIGSLIKVKGTVAVLPGILGVQIFYIVGSPGIQIYNYKKDFPALRVGDYIEVAGELTQTQGEFRIKTKDKNGIKLIEHKTAPPALAIKNDEVNEENIGQLINITGEITDKKSSSLYVDDGSDEIFIYIKQSTGIDTKNLAAGQKISLTGILSKTQTGLRLLPRYKTDIVLIDSTAELEPQVLGETMQSDEWELASRDKKLELFKYLLIIAGGVIIVLAGLFIKAKGKN